MLILKIVKAKNCVFIERNFDIENCLFDSKKAETTWNNHWFKLDKIPEKLERLKPQEKINLRYELIDKTLESEKYPNILKYDEVTYYDEDSCQLRIEDEFKFVNALYEFKFDLNEAEYEEQKFNVEIVFETDEEVKVDRIKSNYRCSFNFFDSLLFPPIMLPQKRCFFSSEEMYSIIRNFVKENIDKKYAIVSSDYDFCFEVSKRIELSNPIEFEIDVNNNFFSKRKRKPKFEKRYKNTKDVKIFQITSEKEKYKGCTIVPKFEAETEEELIDKLNKFLKELIDEINKPIVECPHCNGSGVITKRVEIKYE